MAEEERPIPPRYWYEFLDRFTRRDELLVEILKDVRALLKKLVPPVLPPVLPPEVVPEVTISLEVIDRLARRLQQMPNRFDKLEFDTAITASRSLKDVGKLKGEVFLGFHIEDVGGGFTYKVCRGEYLSPDKKANVDDKMDIEYDDLIVAGEGVAGTGVLWYWYREES